MNPSETPRAGRRRLALASFVAFGLSPFAVGSLPNALAIAGDLPSGTNAAGSQARQGAELYAAKCAACHGAQLQGLEMAPALTGPAFAATWTGVNARELHARVQAMPPGAPRSLTQDQSLALVAFILDRNKAMRGALAAPVTAASLSSLVVAGNVRTAAPAAPGPASPPPPRSGSVANDPPSFDWPTYGGDLANRRYAPLAQIDASNFNALTVAWRFRTDNLGPQPEYKFESTPLVVDGILYTTGGARRAVTALDAATGEQKWVFSLDEGVRGVNAPRKLSGRGLAFWSDGHEKRIVYVTPGYRLVSLDAATGRPVAGFGKEGVVDLKTDFDQPIDDPDTADVGLHATPIIARDTILVGAAHASSPNPRTGDNVKGYFRAFDVKSGKRLWTFHTIPRKGEFGYDSWLKGSAERTGNAGVWTQVAVDEDLNLVYLPVESPTGDVYGGHRPGPGLFGESLVAVDLRTGQRRWHFQTVHHGLWDHDIPSPPVLVDVVKDGAPIKAIAQPTKQSFLFVLDRETGKPVWPIEERPVPKGDVPGEWYSPTQPFSSIVYGRLGIGPQDLVDFTPALRSAAEKVVKPFGYAPMYAPPALLGKNGAKGTLTIGFASNWPGGSLDPETNILYLAVSHDVWVNAVAPQVGNKDVRYGAPGDQTLASAMKFLTEQKLDVEGLPLLKPPYGAISAIDLNAGKVIWTVPNGETPDAIRNHPALAGIDIGRTGRTGWVGALATKSLLIVSEPGWGPTPSGARGSMLRAYDKATGREVGAVELPAPETGAPMTYMSGGRQYLVVAVGGAGHPGELIAFALPR